MTRPSDVDHFTPLFESIVQDIGLIGAAVYGRVWRYCQGDSGRCHASMETIGDALHLSRHTVLRYLTLLCQKGFLIDHTPTLRNHPHTFTVAESHTDDTPLLQSATPTVAESHTHCSRKSQEERRENKREKTPIGDLEAELFPERPPTLTLPGDGHSVRDHTDPLSMIAHCVDKRDHSGGAPDWAMVGAEGVHPFYAVVESFCTMTNQEPDLFQPKQGKRWLTKYEKLAVSHGLSPGDMLQAHEFLPDKDRGAWYIERHKWATPYNDSYEEQLVLAAQQVKAGTITAGNGWSKAY